MGAFPEARLSIALCGDPDMQEYLYFAMERSQLQKPENWESASELFMKLKEIAQLWIEIDQRGGFFCVEVEHCCLSEHKVSKSVTTASLFLSRKLMNEKYSKVMSIYCIFVV